MDELRRRRPLTFSELTWEEEGELALPLALMLDPTPLPEEEVERRERHESLLAAVRSLPPRMRAIVLLRTEGQLSYREIEQVLGIPVSRCQTPLFPCQASAANLMPVRLKLHLAAGMIGGQVKSRRAGLGEGRAK